MDLCPATAAPEKSTPPPQGVLQKATQRVAHSITYGAKSPLSSGHQLVKQCTSEALNPRTTNYMKFFIIKTKNVEKSIYSLSCP